MQGIFSYQQQYNPINYTCCGSKYNDRTRYDEHFRRHAGDEALWFRRSWQFVSVVVLSGIAE